MISQEKVKGWLVEYGRGEIGENPGWVVELEVVPAVWEWYVLKYSEKFNTSDYYGFFAWKRKLSLDEKIKLEENAGILTNQMEKLKVHFLKFQEGRLKYWEDFCKDYQKLKPEQIQEARKYCVLDSVTVPVAPMADSGSVPSAPNKLNGWLVVSYRLDWIDAWEPKAVESVEVIPAAWEYYFSKIGFEPDSEYEWGSGNLHYCYEWKNTLSFEEKRLTRSPEENPELERAKGKIKQFRDFQNDCIESWDLFLESYRHLTQEQIQRARKHFFYNPDVVLVSSAPMANPGTVSAPNSSLVCSELPMAPVDDVKVPMVAPDEKFSEAIKGKEAKIKPIYDVRRETGSQKTNAILSNSLVVQGEMNESLKKMTKMVEAMVEANQQVARNTGTIEQNTQGFNGVNLKPVEEAKKERCAYEFTKENLGKECADAYIAVINNSSLNQNKDIWQVGHPDIDPEKYEDSDGRAIRKSKKKGAEKLINALGKIAGNDPKQDSDS